MKQVYSTAQCHSHNDYEQSKPFELAYENGFGSIEADIWLRDGKLLVSHDIKNLNPAKTLELLYLNPIAEKLKLNKGCIYQHKRKHLQLLIDIKTEATSTLDALINHLQHYPEIIQNKNIKLVISGNRPTPEKMTSYPSFIYFDGRMNEQYDKSSLKKIALISDSFEKFSNWKGEGEINAADQEKIISLIHQVHNLKKPIRFWATPDTKNSWKFFVESGVDFINTDKITELASFLK